MGTPAPTRPLPIYLPVGKESVIADIPASGDAWRWNLVDFKRGKDAVPDGMTAPELEAGRELLAVHVVFTYVGTKDKVSVPRDSFELLGMLQENPPSVVWGPNVYTFGLAGSFPDKDWKNIPRDEQHGYTLFYIVPTGMPNPTLLWNFGKGPDEFLEWTEQIEP